jgi:effector-binding domain-containing protein
MPTLRRRWPDSSVPAGEIAVGTEAPMIIAAVRRQATVDTIMSEAMKAPLWTLTEERAIPTSGHMVFLYHDRPDGMLLNHPDGVAVDIGVKVEQPFAGDPALQCLMTPAGRTAWTRHRGHYEMLPVIHTDIRAWCVEHGHRITGTSWEHYWHWHEEPEQRMTDVFYLLV